MFSVDLFYEFFSIFPIKNATAQEKKVCKDFARYFHFSEMSSFNAQMPQIFLNY